MVHRVESLGDLNVLNSDREGILGASRAEGKIEECVAHYSLKMISQQET